MFDIGVRVVSERGRSEQNERKEGRKAFILFGSSFIYIYKIKTLAVHSEYS